MIVVSFSELLPCVHMEPHAYSPASNTYPCPGYKTAAGEVVLLITGTPHTLTSMKQPEIEYHILSKSLNQLVVSVNVSSTY